MSQSMSPTPRHSADPTASGGIGRARTELTGPFAPEMMSEAAKFALGF